MTDIKDDARKESIALAHSKTLHDQAMNLIDTAKLWEAAGNEDRAPYLFMIRRAVELEVAAADCQPQTWWRVQLAISALNGALYQLEDYEYAWTLAKRFMKQYFEGATADQKQELTVLYKEAKAKRPQNAGE